MIMMVTGVIFNLCNWQNSVTFIEAFKMTPITTNLNVFSFTLLFPIGKHEDREDQGGVQGNGHRSL
jgi:hypothetical protein